MRKIFFRFYNLNLVFDNLNPFSVDKTIFVFYSKFFRNLQLNKFCQNLKFPPLEAVRDFSRGCTNIPSKSEHSNLLSF